MNPFSAQAYLPFLQDSGDSTASLLLSIVVILFTLVIIYLIVRGYSQSRTTPPAEASRTVASPAIENQADDLTILEGVGPKIASVLQDAGITTFRQLAGTEIDRLEEILKEAKLSFSDPGSWPDQAQLAAEGKLEELKALQDRLKGGR